MEVNEAERVTGFKSQRRADCAEARLVLNAAGIAAEMLHRDGWWLLRVDPKQELSASSELSAYREENPIPREGVPAPRIRHEGAGLGVVLYLAILLLITFWVVGDAFGMNWQAVGRMEAGNVRSGEWWRCLTALTLHLDPAHVVANLVFGAIFGLISGRILGGGVAWLAILIAGTTGNFVNALIQPPSHTSIGASTAVFAALGLIVVDALRRGAGESESKWKRWSPLIGGLVLFAFTGIGGEQTDVAAHLSGLFCGMLAGWMIGYLPDRWLASSKVQAGAGIAAVATVICGWSLAFSFAG
jgi:membrane associated rhomboid family serine protease